MASLIRAFVDRAGKRTIVIPQPLQIAGKTLSPNSLQFEGIKNKGKFYFFVILDLFGPFSCVFMHFDHVIFGRHTADNSAALVQCVKMKVKLTVSLQTEAWGVVLT